MSRVASPSAIGLFQSSALVICLAIASAAAQSINFDFGNGSGVPAPTYGAAGLPGVWNGIQADPGDFPPPPIGPIPLVDLAGNATGAAITITDAFGTLADIPFPHPETGVHQPLLGDGLLGAFGPSFPVEITITGLEPGWYRVISYTWYAPGDQFAMLTTVEGSDVLYPVGGPWLGDLTLSATHMVHTLPLTGSTLRLKVSGSGPGAFFCCDTLINGLQLWKFDDVPATPCGQAGQGDCYAPHASAGCSESDCCTTVCDLDPYCCRVAWDGLCVGLANLQPDCVNHAYPHCGSPNAADCLQANESAQPGCADPDCCRRICDMDPFCCSYSWDGVCAAMARFYCSDIPPGCGHPEAGDCFNFIGMGNPTPYCDDAECCERVCEIAPICCEGPWEPSAEGTHLCISIAQAVCDGGKCGTNPADCFTPHPETGGCMDPGCCQLVCEQVPCCCLDFTPQTGCGWNDNCVGWAMKLCQHRAAGDMNCDDFIDMQDLNPFVLALADPDVYRQRFPLCGRYLADVNGDNQIDGHDVRLFVAMLIGEA